MVKAAFPGSLPFVCRSAAAGSPPIPRRLCRCRQSEAESAVSRIVPAGSPPLLAGRCAADHEHLGVEVGGGTLVPAWSVACRPPSSPPPWLLAPAVFPGRTAGSPPGVPRLLHQTGGSEAVCPDRRRLSFPYRLAAAKGSRRIDQRYASRHLGPRLVPGAS
jgi:hypothetical protein